MALRQASKLFNTKPLQLVRNKSRFVPSLWEDPFRHQRSLFGLHPADLWHSDPFDMLFPATRLTRIRSMPSLAWEEDEHLANPKDGFQVSLNVQNFAPEEISVKVVNNQIIVEAKHEERADGEESYVSRHISRRYVLPEQYSIKDVVSTLSSDGILTVKAPPKEIDPKNVRNIDIQHTGPAKLNQSASGEEAKQKESETDSKKE